jgi:hypothetical protein
MDIAQMEIQARCDRDEIRRLREVNAQLRAEIESCQGPQWYKAWKDSEAEVEKLRAALERIDTRARGGQDSTIVAALAALASIRQTARAVLAPEVK